MKHIRTGWLDRAGVQKLLSQARVYVQTSRWEGMPLSVLQALAAGVPCVVTDAVGNRDAVRQGITGFVAKKPEEALVCLRRLLQDEALWQRFSSAAREDATRRFSSASFRARLLKLYRLGAAPTHDPQPLLTLQRDAETGFAPGLERGPAGPVVMRAVPAVNGLAVPAASVLVRAPQQPLPLQAVNG